MFILIILCVLILVFLVKTIASFKGEKTQATTRNESAVSDASVSGEKRESNELHFFCIKDNGYHVTVWPNVDGYVDVDYIEFDIAGITHHSEVAMMHIGETCGFLAAEPDNPYDANAIRIMTPDWQCIGYVPKDRTDEIREHTKLPCPCLFYIGASEENGDQIFYTDAYIRLDMLNNK